MMDLLVAVGEVVLLVLIMLIGELVSTSSTSGLHRLVLGMIFNV